MLYISIYNGENYGNIHTHKKVQEENALKNNLRRGNLNDL